MFLQTLLFLVVFRHRFLNWVLAIIKFQPAPVRGKMCYWSWQKMFPSLYEGADSDRHHLEPVTCREDYAQRVEGGRGVKRRCASCLMDPRLVQTNDEYLPAQTVENWDYSNMLLSSNKLSVILLMSCVFFCKQQPLFIYHWWPSCCQSRVVAFT